MKSITVVLICILLSFVSCKKENSCFNQDLFQKFTIVDCSTNCINVIGCDGNLYCNECVANQNGIAVK
jgi:hypothetical protein